MTGTLARTADPKIERNLSWLDFDRRVLELASDEARPLAERLKLFAIVASNLDEFFSVRVARLEALAPGSRTVLARVRSTVLDLQGAQDALWREELQPSLAAGGVRILAGARAWDRSGGADAYRREIEPVVGRARLGSSRILPPLDSGRIAVAACSRDDDGRVAFGLALVPRGPRFVCVGGDWLFLDDGVARHAAAALLPGRTVDAVSTLRVTRSSELAPQPAGAEPRSALDRQLAERRFGALVRVEVAAGTPDWLADALAARLGLHPDQVYRSSSPVGLADLRDLVGCVPAGEDRPGWTPSAPAAFRTASPDELFRRLRGRPRLVHHPYESFEDSVQTFASASSDDAVTELAATVYRTSRPSGMLAALVDTAAAGKRAVCLVELRARFDEQQNLEWSRTLSGSGVEVVHGPDALKVHAKLMLITREEADGTHRYAHIGTGNYHAWNAFGYEDLSLFTADPELTADVAQLFAAVAGGKRPTPFRRLLVGPWYLRDGLMREIAATVAAARAGLRARICIKVNSLGDDAIVSSLYAASQAGVDVDLIVRGVCTLVPGVPGTSDRIRVRSVLGRFLEHSRIFSFEIGDERRIWLGSPDLLTRNLDLRVETLAPVDDHALQLRLGWILDTLLADTSTAWELGADRTWRRAAPPTGVPPLSAQDAFMALTAVAAESR